MLAADLKQIFKGQLWAEKNNAFLVCLFNKYACFYSCPCKFVKEMVKYAEGRDLACKIGAFAYVECSAKSGEGVKEVSK